MAGSGCCFGPHFCPTGGALKFRLVESAFDSGTKFNTKDKLRALKRILFKKYSTKALPTLGSYELISSPLHSLTLSDSGRAKAGIPLDAAFYSFCHPVLEHADCIKEMREAGIQMDDPFVMWLIAGAFMYFDFHFDIIGINATSISPTKVVLGGVQCTQAVCTAWPPPPPATCPSHPSQGG